MPYEMRQKSKSGRTNREGKTENENFPNTEKAHGRKNSFAYFWRIFPFISLIRLFLVAEGQIWIRYYTISHAMPSHTMRHNISYKVFDILFHSLTPSLLAYLRLLLIGVWVWVWVENGIRVPNSCHLYFVSRPFNICSFLTVVVCTCHIQFYCCCFIITALLSLVPALARCRHNTYFISFRFNYYQ